MRTRTTPAVLAAPLVSLALLYGCGNELAMKAEMSYTPITPELLTKKYDADILKGTKVPPEIATTIEGALVNGFGTPNHPAATQVAFLDTATLARGRQHFVKNCAHCHGMYGEADGPTAPFLFPRPRDFSRKGYVKFYSTTRGFPSLKNDLERTIREGIQASAMPAFGHPYGPVSMHRDKDGKDAPNSGVVEVAQYVTLLMMRARLEELLVNEWNANGELPPDVIQEKTKDVIDTWREAQDPTKRLQPEKPKPPVTKETIARGKQLFLSPNTQCAACHGDDGKGEGPSMQDPKNRKDDWGNEVKARDLTAGIYRGGRRPIDLYRRFRLGIKGVVMPGFNTGGEFKSDDDFWALVDYVKSLPLEEGGGVQVSLVAPKDGEKSGGEKAAGSGQGEKR